MSFLEFIADRPLIIAMAVLIMTVSAFYIFVPNSSSEDKQ